jgi:phage major head subunit gpT-like protein
MSTIIDTGLTTSALKGNFFSALKAVHPVWRELTSIVKSTTATEHYRWLGSVPQMRQWGTGRLAKGLRSESYSVENQKYEATLEVDRDELADDQLGQIIVRIRELARRAAAHPDKLLADMLEHGADPGYTSYDGKPFFAEDHPGGPSGSQSNKLSYNVIDPASTSPTDFGSSYAKAVETMLTFVDDQNEPANTEIGKLVALVPANLWYKAKQALTAQFTDMSSNIFAGESKVILFPRLTSADTWYLCRTDVEVRPFIFQDREPLEFTALTEGSEEAFKREKYLYGVRARYALAFGYWQHCIRIQYV